jgi:hypothetical protein
MLSDDVVERSVWLVWTGLLSEEVEEVSLALVAAAFATRPQWAAAAAAAEKVAAGALPQWTGVAAAAAAVPPGIADWAAAGIAAGAAAAGAAVAVVVAAAVPEAMQMVEAWVWSPT